MKTKKPAERKELYTGCYSCKYFKLLGPAGSWGKCLNPLEAPSFNVALEHIISGIFNYPEFFYPTGMICGINNCPNWADKKVVYDGYKADE